MAAKQPRPGELAWLEDVQLGNRWAGPRTTPRKEAPCQSAPLRHARRTVRYHACAASARPPLWSYANRVDQYRVDHAKTRISVRKRWHISLSARQCRNDAAPCAGPCYNLGPPDYDRSHHQAVGDADLLTVPAQGSVKEAGIPDLAAVLDPTERSGAHRDVHAGTVWTGKQNSQAGKNVAERGLRGDTHDHARQRAAHEQPAQIESCAGTGQQAHDAVQDDRDEPGHAAGPPQVHVALQGTLERLYEGTERRDRDQRAG